MSDNEEFIQEFLVECGENLDQLDQDLVALEANPRDPQRLASIFRTIHTIKGTSGFFGFAKLGAVTHAGENLLGRLRDGELLLSGDIANALLQLVDTVREILAAIEQAGGEGHGDYSSLITRLGVLAAQPAAAVIPDAGPHAESHGEVGEELPRERPDTSRPEESAERVEPEIAAPEETATATVSSALPVPRSDESGPADGAGPDIQAERHVAPEDVSEDTPQVSQEEAAAKESLREGPVPESDQTEPDEVETPVTAPSTPPLGTVRVDVGLLNDLMNQVGELVLARNQIRPFADAIEDRVFTNALQQLDLITGDLQEGIMKTRMQPIGNQWTRLPRVVRDLAQAKGKHVHLEMHGHETELDRTLIEAIKDPLTHLVRNAVDHGIESPQVRQGAGKPGTGKVVLRAFHEGGLVNVEISDDGAGIDPERVRDKALRQGLISAEQARRMSAQQITQLIFLPGLSTAERVTDISGRGVGMDVVKTNIERIGGSVAIDSRLGRGTTLRVKIPLTLAIIPVLMVISRGQRFAIPQVSLREIITLFDEASSTAIESIGDALVYRLRGELLPLIRLSDALQLPASAEQRDDSFANVVVLEAIGQRFGLIVDQVARTEEIVVKPLHKTLAQIPVFSGATVLGNGRVALILDVAGLARTAGVQQREESPVDGQVEEEDSWEEGTSEFGDFLVCEASPGRSVAIPLSDVTRLEEFATQQLRMDQGQGVIPYRDRLMPLLPLEGYRLPDDDADGHVYVVVYSVGDRHVGLLMHRILDVLPASQAIDASQQRAGLRGRVLMEGRVLDVVDIAALVRSAGILFPPAAAEVVS